MKISLQGQSFYSTGDYRRFSASANILNCKNNQYNQAMRTHEIAGSAGFVTGSSGSALGLLVISSCFDCGITAGTCLAVVLLGGAAGGVYSNDVSRSNVSSLKSDVEKSVKNLTETMRKAEENAKRSASESFGYLNRVFTIDTSQIMVSPG